MDELYIELEDDQWEKEYIDTDRNIARAIVFDDDLNFYFVRVSRDDEFGKASYIETSGGGIEKGEDPEEALRRELKEELGISVDILCRIGIVSDYYNLIHRHNINSYYLCKVLFFGKKQLTDDEMNLYHLNTAVLSYDDAVKEYEKGKASKIGSLVYAREFPVLRRAKKLLKILNYYNL